MALRLAEMSRTVEPGAHAVLLLDQSGQRMSAKRAAPPDITLMPLPLKAPELNPVENLRQFIRDHWLSNRIFQSYDDIRDDACAAFDLFCSRKDWRMSSRSRAISTRRAASVRDRAEAR